MLSKIISLLEEEIERDFTSTSDFDNWEWGKGKAVIDIECNNTLYHIDYSLWGFKKVAVTVTVYTGRKTTKGLRFFPSYTNTPITELLSHAFVYLLRDRYDELEKEEELLKEEKEATEEPFNNHNFDEKL